MIDGVVETALYVDDLPRAREFYETILELEVLDGDARFCAFNVARQQVLLLFKRGASTSPITLAGGTIPPHDGGGTEHVGFAINAGSVKDWEARLAKHGVAVESKMTWARGGTSLYFRDPDGHLLELLTPGVWTIY
jgi:catechol 2,3-dioxygenase-like lactoylglutathione lyase family enzyme